MTTLVTPRSLFLLLDLALVVERVVADPVPGDGRGEHAVGYGEGVADGEGVRADLGAEGGGAGADLGRLELPFSSYRILKHM